MSKVKMYYVPGKQVEEVDPKLREFLLRENPQDWKDMEELTAKELEEPNKKSGDPLDKMTVKALREYADEHDIDLGDATKKPDILEAIKAHQING